MIGIGALLRGLCLQLSLYCTFPERNRGLFDDRWAVFSVFSPDSFVRLRGFIGSGLSLRSARRSRGKARPVFACRTETPHATSEKA